MLMMHLLRLRRAGLDVVVALKFLNICHFCFADHTAFVGMRDRLNRFLSAMVREETVERSNQVATPSALSVFGDGSMAASNYGESFSGTRFSAIYRW